MTDVLAPSTVETARQTPTTRGAIVLRRQANFIHHRIPAHVIAAACALTFVAAGLAGSGNVARAGGTLVWPGTCSGTLQQCVDGASPDSTIFIDVDGSISETITIQKSLVLEPQSPGQHPDITGGIKVNDVGSATNVVVYLERITTSAVSVGFAHANGSKGFTLDRGHVDGTNGLQVITFAPASLTVQDSYLRATDHNYAGVYLDNESSGHVQLDVIGDTISGNGGQEGSRGIFIAGYGSGSTTTAQIDSDVVWSTYGNAVDVSQHMNAGTVTADVIGDTLDGGLSDGLSVSSDSSRRGIVAVNVFDDILSHNAGAGVHMTAPRPAAITLRAGNNDEFGNGHADVTLGESHGLGNLAVSPHFAAPASGDLHLSATSPLIDAGSACPTAGAGIALTDADGNDRFFGRNVDMGAYERGSSVNGPTIVIGTKASQTLTGTAGDDVICGQGGNDTIKGKGGNDYLDGGPGGDRITGGPGADQLFGGPGNDTLCASDQVKGNDTLNGGSGTDTGVSDRHDVRISVEEVGGC
jgi:Ca2+-binding RTX toxin-like protein